MKETTKKRLAAGLALSLLIFCGYWLFRPVEVEIPAACDSVRVFPGDSEAFETADSPEIGVLLETLDDLECRKLLRIPTGEAPDGFHSAIQLMQNGERVLELWLLQVSNEDPYHCRVWTGEKELRVQDSEALGEALRAWIEGVEQKEELP